MKTAFTKAMIVLVPSYTVAFITEKMVYVLPTLVATGFFAASLDAGKNAVTNRVDEDATDPADDSIEAKGAD